MKKYLLGIILFIAGIALMGTGLVMQFTMVPKTTNANNTGSTENGEEIVEEKELQDVSTFDFGTVTGAVLTGQAGGYLVVCDNNSIIPTPVNAMSLNGLFVTYTLALTNFLHFSVESILSIFVSILSVSIFNFFFTHSPNFVSHKHLSSLIN